MQEANDLGRSSTVLEQSTTLIAVIEKSLSSWLVAGIVPGLDRHPLKKLGADEDALLRLLHRWREEAAKFGHTITRIAVAFEAGRDGFWLARWLRVRGVEAFVIHSTSIAVSREHRRAKTDRLDTEHLKRALVCTKNLSSGVVVMKSAQDGKRPDHTGSLNRARSGRILIQGQVSPRLIIVASVRFQNPAQMCLAQDNDVVHTFTPDRSDQPFDKAIVPG